MAGAEERVQVEVVLDDDTKAGAETAEKNLGGLLKSYVDISSAIADLGRVAKAAWGAMSDRVELAGVQEVAENRIKNALIATNQFTKANSEAVLENASALQRMIGVGDEAILQQQAMALTLGASVDQLSDMSIAAAGAAAIGLEQNTVMRGLAQSLDGNVTMLGRYIPALRNMTEEQLRAGGAIEFLGEQFGDLARGEVLTFQGRVTDLKNSWGDLGEQIGQYVTENALVKAAISETANEISNQADQMKELDKTTSEYEDTVFSLIDAWDILRTTGNLLASGIDGLRVGFHGFAVLEGILVEQVSLSISDHFRVASDRAAMFSSKVGNLSSKLGALAGVGEWVQEIYQQVAVTFADSAAAASEHAGDAADSVGKNATALNLIMLARAESDRQLEDSIVAHDLYKRKVLAARQAILDAKDPLDQTSDKTKKLGDDATGAAANVSNLAAGIRELIETNDDLVASVVPLGPALADVVDGFNELAAASASAGYQELIDQNQIATMAFADLWGVIESFPVEILNNFQQQYDATMRAIIEGTPGAQDAMRALVAEMHTAENELGRLVEADNLASTTLSQALTQTTSITIGTMTEMMAAGIAVSAGWAEASTQSAEQTAAAWGATITGMISQLLLGVTTTVIGKAIEAAANQTAAYSSIPVAGPIIGLAAGTAIFGVISALLTKLPAAAEGGLVQGPGQRGVDSVLMWTAPGELIIPSDTVELLTSSMGRQAGGRPGGGGGASMTPSIPGAAAGGVVQGRTPAAVPGEIHVHLPEGFSDPGSVRAGIDRSIVPVLRDSLRQNPGFRRR